MSRLWFFSEFSGTYGIKDKALNEQGSSVKTITFIAVLHRDYWCETQDERNKLIKQFELNEKRINAEIADIRSIKDRLDRIKYDNKDNK